ncbi:MAG: MFS transporter [Planctomycetaceae bacterium]
MNIGARLSVMMFLQFFIWGAWYVTVGNFMKAHGMAAAIADAYTVGPIAAILSPFFLGMVADRFFSTERILGVMHVAGGIVLCCAPFAIQGAEAQQGLFIGILLLYMLFYMPTLGLTNTLAFHNIVDQERQFPIIRVFGTIGWIVANVFVSYVLVADEKALQFYVAGGAGILLGIYSFSLPHTPPPMAGRAARAKDILGLDSLALMKSPSFAVFMVSSFLICIPLAAYYAYAPVFVNAVGSAKAAAAAGEAGFFKYPAFVMSTGQMSEIIFMLVMPFFFRRLGVKGMLLVGMGAWVLRYGLFAVGAPETITWMILFGILLHGICYDFFFVTGQIYVDKKAGPAIRGQAQGFLVLVTQGIGMLIGAQVTGRIFNGIVGETGTLADWAQFWWIPCVAAAVIMAAFALLFHDRATASVVDVSEGDVATAAIIEEHP